MRKSSHLFAFSVTWLLFSLLFGYAFGQFIVPGETEMTSGILGWDTETIPLFNWRAFLLCFCICYAVSPILQLLFRRWGPAIIELALLAISAWMVLDFAPVSLSGSEEDAGLLGFNTVTKKTFRTELLLVMICALFALYSLARFIFEKKQGPKGFLSQPAVGLVLLMIGWASVMCYFFGIHVPVFHSTKFWFFEDEVSLVQSVEAFFKAEENFIGVIVLIFTLIFPVIKFIYMFWMLLAEPGKLAHQVNKVLSFLGKYSMLDVFVLALLLLNLKFDSNILDMELRSGLWWFALSILLNMLVASLLTFRGAQDKRLVPDADQELP